MDEIIKFFKENYKKESLFNLAIKFHNIFLSDDCFTYDEVFKHDVLYLMCNLDIVHISKEDFRVFTSKYLFERIAKTLYNYKSSDVMEIE